MTRTKRIVFTIALAGIVLAAIEILCRGAHRVIFSRAYDPAQLRQLARPMDWERMVAEAAGPNWMRGEILHPYLGYVRDSDQAATHGLLTEAFVRSDDPSQLVVGIAGGSVALQLVPQIELLFREHLADGSHELDPVFVRLGLPGYKQPQQLLAVSYLLALGGHLDLLINVDGYNEIVLPTKDNYDHHTFPFFPRMWKKRLQVRSGVSDLALVARIQSMRQDQRQLLQQARTGPWRYSAALGLFQAWRITSLGREALEAELVLAQSSGEGGGFETDGPYREYGSSDQLFAESAQVWLRSSLVLAQIADGLGISYHHFLQPNRHVEGSKPLSGEERKIEQPTHPRARYAREGYRYLIEAGSQLPALGVPYHDLTMIFQNHPETLYVDSCCHLNERGLKILARRIFGVVLQESNNEALRLAEPIDGGLELGR